MEEHKERDNHEGKYSQFIRNYGVIYWTQHGKRRFLISENLPLCCDKMVIFQRAKTAEQLRESGEKHLERATGMTGRKYTRERTHAEGTM